MLAQTADAQSMYSPTSKILIVDDMPTIVDLLKIQLKALGFRFIYEANDGDQAIQFLNRHFAARGEIDLIISDWNMPNVSGLEFLKLVRSTPEWKKIPFILLTSEGEREQVTEAVLAGVTSYILKPFTTKILEDKLKAAWLKTKDQKK